MKHLLREGQVFKCRKFKDLCGSLERDDVSGKPYVDCTKLSFGFGSKITAYWTEKGKDGWIKEHKETVDLSINDNMAKKKFVVVSVAFTGGTGPNSHDPYPDGHYVEAEEVDGHRVVSFYQTGCFTNMIDPKDIDLVSGPADKEVNLKKKVSWEEE